MKNVFLLLAFACVFSCNNDTNEVIPELPMELFEYRGAAGTSFSATQASMHYDSDQEATVIKYTKDELELELSFDGRQAGTYETGKTMFYASRFKTGENDVVSVFIDIACGCNSEVIVEVEEYGAIGELIKGTFSAQGCQGSLNEGKVKGSFSVIRTE